MNRTCTLGPAQRTCTLGPVPPLRFIGDLREPDQRDGGLATFGEPVGPPPPEIGGSLAVAPVVFVPLLGVVGVGETGAGLVLSLVDMAMLLGLDRYCGCPWPDLDTGTGERDLMNCSTPLRRVASGAPRFANVARARSASW